ncbi:MAG: radical SAM protein [Pyrinomonadaceae bacterium]
MLNCRHALYPRGLRRRAWYHSSSAARSRQVAVPGWRGAQDSNRRLLRPWASAMIYTDPLSPAETQKFLSGLFSLADTTLAIEVMRSCNLRCPGCWVGISRDDLWSAAKHEAIGERLLHDALAMGRSLGITKLSLLGGEPTLHPNLDGIIKGARAAGYERISVTTNGVTPHERLYRVISAGITNISFSLDGSTPEIHDALRPSPNGRSTFPVTLRNLEMAVAHSVLFGYSVRTNHTIFLDNILDAEDMIRLAHGKGVRRVRLHFSMPNDLPDGSGYIDPRLWLRVCHRMEVLRKDLDIEIAVPLVYGTSQVAQARSKKPSYINLQPDGNILLCATHARLPDPARRSFAFIEDGLRIRLNKRSIIFDDEIGGSCCKGVTELVRHMPQKLQSEITECGGMGCVILHSPLDDR